MRTYSGVIQIIRLSAIILPVLGLCFASAHADVTVTEKVVFDGFGGRGWGSNESENILRISGDRMQQEMTNKMTGKIMKRLSRKNGNRSGSIVRLDKGMMYSLDYKNQSYIEMPFARIREAGQETFASMSVPEMPQGESEEAEMNCESLDLAVKNTGKTAEIAGLTAKRTNIKGQHTCTNTETDETCTISYQVSVWIANDAPGMEESMAFMKKQAEAMGFDMTKVAAKSRASSALLFANASGLENAMKELGKIEGLPLRTKVEIYAEGTCAQAAATDEIPTAKTAMKNKFKKATKFFKRNRLGSKTKKTSTKEPAGPKRSKLFGMINEVVSISTDSVPASTFEIPDGFKKQSWEAPGK
jgi:hypothetical protein